MRRRAFEATLALLLVASLTVKVIVAARSTESAAPAASDPVANALAALGFKVTFPAPGDDPPWIVGERPGCRVEIAEVSAQGWHRGAARRRAMDARLYYSYRGALYGEQPAFRTNLDEYLRRIEGHFGFPAPRSPVRAIILGRGCPDRMAAIATR